jgi:hypothetical protein
MVACIALLTSLVGCPNERPWFQTNALLDADPKQHRALAIFARAGLTEHEGRSNLVAVDLDSGAVQTLVANVTGPVRSLWTPSFLVVATAGRNSLFERDSLSQLDRLPGVELAETSSAADLAITMRGKVLQLDTRRELDLADPRHRPQLGFSHDGQEVLALSCPDDDKPLLRVRTFALSDVAEATDAIALRPTRDFTLELDAQSVTWVGAAAAFCAGPILFSASDRFAATIFRTGDPVVLDLEAQSGRALIPEDDPDTFQDQHNVAFSPDERNFIVLGPGSRVMQARLPELEVGEHHELRDGYRWNHFVLVADCGALYVFDQDAADSLPAALPYPQCALNGTQLWDFLRRHSVELTTGDVTPAPDTGDAAVVRYVPELDRILALREQPPALVVIQPGGPTMELPLPAP